VLLFYSFLTGDDARASGRLSLIVLIAFGRPAITDVARDV